MTDELDLPELPELPSLPEIWDSDFASVEGTRIRPPEEFQGMTKAEWGPIKWQELEAWADSIPCVECRDFAVMMVRANHDVVNVKLDKRVYDEANLRKYIVVVDSVKADLEIQTGSMPQSER